MAYHFKRSGEVMDQLFDKAETALQEHQDISHLAEKAEVQAELDEKQNNIEDLADIRAGAAKGATAIQEHQDVSHLAEKTAVEESLAKKQEVVPDLDEIRSGAKLGSTSIQDISHLATNEDVLSWLSEKVDKIAGKQLTTEDFTTALKDKLESLSNYDDASIKATVQSLQTQLNTLVDGDATSAIDTFNEIIAFLSSVEDTESLSSIIASIEQQIADKQDVISDLASIREGAAKGATALQEHQQLKTINGESIIGSGNITIQGGSGGSGGGSGITIVDSVDKLDQTAPIGSVAVVAKKGQITTTSFRNLYQPTADDLSQDLGTLTRPEQLSRVTKLDINFPNEVIQMPSEAIAVYFIPRDFSINNFAMAAIMIGATADATVGQIMAMSQTDKDYGQYALCEYVEGVPQINQDGIDGFLTMLSDPDVEWCYFGNLETLSITEDEFNVIDKFFMPTVGFNTVSDLYIFGDSWTKVDHTAIQRLEEDIRGLEARTNFPVEILDASANYIDIYSNTYSKLAIPADRTKSYSIYTYTYNVDETIANEFILELDCTKAVVTISLPSSIKWVNEDAPVFSVGKKYVISIVGGLGVWGEF